MFSFLSALFAQKRRGARNGSAVLLDASFLSPIQSVIKESLGQKTQL